MKEYLSLYELNSMVRDVIEVSMDREYWVEAEISELREVHGHCFMDLIEKDERSHTPIARASARCWQSRWKLVKEHFMRIAGKPLQAGMKALLLVTASFHENYGFAWIVNDINPEYTLGDMARRRQEIVRQLKAEGVFDLQHELSVPLFCQHIAIISSEGAAGYGDFVHQLLNNEEGLYFNLTLFPAVMQGEQVEQSVIAALDRIAAQEEDFDCVVIIRGGGATSELSGFDTLALAENVANFPLPIIVGLGHQRDESILDMIACVSVKTPTAAAAFLVGRLQAVAERIEQARNTLARRVTESMRYARLHLQQIQMRIPTSVSLSIARQQARLQRVLPAMAGAIRHGQAERMSMLNLLSERLSAAMSQQLLNESHHVELLAQRASALDPQRVLARGYSLTFYRGHVLKSAEGVVCGDFLETRLSKGVIKSVVAGNVPMPSAGKNHNSGEQRKPDRIE